MQTKIGLRDKDFTKPASDSLYPSVAEFKKRDNDNEDISTPF